MDLDGSDAAPADADSRCARCGGDATPIAYGYPGHEMWEAAERGEILLGGCVVFDGQPTRRCGQCGADSGWRDLPDSDV